MRKLLCGLLSLSVLFVYANSHTEKGSYAIVNTVHSELMDSVVSIIKRTDLKKVYSLTGLGENNERIYTDFTYEFSLYQKNSKTGKYEYPSYLLEEQNFIIDGTYMFTVTGTVNMLTWRSYIFKINELSFYTNTYLKGFFTNIVGYIEKDYVIGGGGYSWTFRTDRGSIVEAYAYYSTSEVPFKVIDMIGDKIIDYDEKLNLF